MRGCCSCGRRRTWRCGWLTTTTSTNVRSRWSWPSSSRSASNTSRHPRSSYWPAGFPNVSVSFTSATNGGLFRPCAIWYKTYYYCFKYQANNLFIYLLVCVWRQRTQTNTRLSCCRSLIVRCCCQSILLSLSDWLGFCDIAPLRYFAVSHYFWTRKAGSKKRVQKSLRLS